MKIVGLLIDEPKKITRQQAEEQVEVATAIGPIDFSEGKDNCEPFNVLKHLTTSENLKKKLGV